MNILAKSDMVPTSNAAQDCGTQRYRAVVEAAHDAILAIDDDGLITLFNHAAERMFGYDASELIGQPLAILLPFAARDIHPHHISRFGRGTDQHRCMTERSEVRGRRKDGSEFPVEISLAKIDVAGATEFTAVMRDISQQIAIVDRLRQRATTDPLTGLGNRRFLEERKSELKSLADRYGTEIAVIMLDIDHFKKVNDNFGHDVGDHVLQALARTTENILRKSDVLVRFGGEEFVILMPETHLSQACGVAERLRRQFEEGDLPFTWKTDPVPFTVSIGVTRYLVGKDNSLTDTICRADAALYHAKAQGRNRVEVAAEPDDDGTDATAVRS